MDPGRWRQIEQLYDAALQKKASERALFLEQSCVGDPTLRREVESLLAVADNAVRDTTRPPAESRKLGRYELLEQVGKGGMGVVYRAVDPAIGRTVAIKTILLDVAAGEQSQELRVRLLRESQAGGQLSHPNIVAVYDVCEQDNTTYIVMEYVVGQTLDKAMASDSSLRSTAGAIQVIQECAMALDYAHSRGIVHRDIKPGNIMLQPDGAVKITDFGIAKVAQFSQLTKSAVIMGSPHYMAPEQWKGEEVTGQTDQYALAAVAYAMLTGHRPFEDETMASIAGKTLYEEARAPTTLNAALPAPVDGVFRKALAKAPAARYESCSLFAGALLAACEKPPAALAVPVPPVPAPAPARRESKWSAPVIVAALAVVAVLAAGGWLYQRNSAAQVEIAFWTSIKDSKNSGMFDAYLKRYPEGQFASLAKAQLQGLKNERPAEARPVTLPLPKEETKAPKETIAPKQTSEPKETKTRAKVNPVKTTDKSGRDTVPPPVAPPVEPPAGGDPYIQGEDSLKSGAYSDAVRYFSKALSAKPEYRSYFGRAGAYQHLELMKEAIDDYSQAIQLNPGSAMAYHERAVCLARMKDDDRAFADYNRALALAPNLALSWNGRGVIYLHRKQYQSAISDFTAAIRLNPNLIQPYRNRAAAKRALGDTAGATADRDEAIRRKQ